MKIVMKIAMVLAIIVLVASATLAVWQYGQGKWWGGQLATIPDATPRQELYDTFFQSINWPEETTALAAGTDFTFTWKHLSQLPTDAEFFFRIVDQERGIFIGETIPQPFQDADGATLQAPTKAGKYELWLYVITAGEEGLVAVSPITVQ